MMTEQVNGFHPPEHIFNAGIHTIRFSEHNVQVRIDRLRQHTDRLTGEVTIRTMSSGVPTHLHQSTVNLSSGTTRRSLAGILTKRWGSPPWDDIIETAFVLVLRKHREGEPAVTLKGAGERKRQNWRLAPYLQEKVPTILFGKGEATKSTLATFFAVVVDGSVFTLGLEPEPGNVLYLDWEADKDEVAARIHMMQRGLDIPEASDHILYRRCWQSLANEIEEIQKIVIDNKIDMVIIDSIGPAAGGEPEKSDVTLVFFQALRTLEVTSVLIGHVSKEAMGLNRKVERKPFGSVFWENLARSTFEVRKSQEPEEATASVGLFHRKMNAGRKMSPTGFKFTFSEDAITVGRENVREMGEVAEGMPLKNRMIEALKAGAVETSELAEDLGVAGSSIRVTATRFPAVFQRVTRTSWGLKA
jgi:hypothetical protein